MGEPNTSPTAAQQSGTKSTLTSRIAYAFGNVGQSAFYNALSTYFIVYVTSSLFSGVD